MPLLRLWVLILTRAPDTANRTRVIYSMTPKGADLIPVILDLIAWLPGTTRLKTARTTSSQAVRQICWTVWPMTVTA